MDNFRPNSLITGIVSVLIIGAVFITAIAGRIYTGGATFYDAMQTNSNRSRSNTANAATNRSLPANNTGSFPSGGGMTGNLNTGNTYTGNTYTAPTPAPSVSNSYSGNTNTTSKNTERSSTPSRFNWQVIKPQATIYSSPSTGSTVAGTVENGDRLINLYRENDQSKWYFVTTESGIEGWIDGNAIEQVSPTQIF